MRNIFFKLFLIWVSSSGDVKDIFSCCGNIGNFHVNLF